MKALFVGLGSIGQRHLRNLKTLCGDDLELLAYRALGSRGMIDSSGKFHADIDPAEYHRVKVFNSLDAALEQTPDITVIANPSSLHVQTAIAAANAGSHLLIEKPLSDSMDGLDELTDIVDRNKLVAAVAFQFRFHPTLNAVKRWLTEGRIGDIVLARLVNGEYMPGWHPWEDYRGTYPAVKALGGGAIATQSHEFDYAHWLFGSPRSVYALGGHLSDLEMDVEDVALVTIDFGSSEKALPVSISLDYLQRPPTKTCSIVGTKGKIECDLLSWEATLTPADGDESEIAAHPEFERNEMYSLLLKNFLQSVSGDASPVVSLAEAIESMRTIDSAKASLRSGRPVTL